MCRCGAKQHFDYRLALQKEGQWEQAEQQYKIALSFKPADAKSHMNLATVLTAQAKCDAAVPHVEEALRLQPNNGEFHFELCQFAPATRTRGRSRTSIRSGGASPAGLAGGPLQLCIVPCLSRKRK